MNPQCSATPVAQRTVAKKFARNDASNSNHSKSTSAPGIRKRNQFCHMSVLGRSNPTKKESRERRAAQTELKIAPNNAVQKHREKPCRTRLNTFTLAMRSTSTEFSNQVHAARDLAVRCSNKHSVTPWNREAVFRNLGVVQDLLRKWSSSVSHCGLASTNYDNEFITTSQQRGSSLMGGEKTRTHHNTNQLFLR